MLGIAAAGGYAGSFAGRTLKRRGTLIRHRCISAAFFIAAIQIARLSPGQYDPPAGYYATATGTGATLKSQLNTIIKTSHTPISYDAARSALQVTDDATPQNLNDDIILLVYDRVQLNVANLNGPPPGWDFGDSWDREHTWPQSRGLSNTSMPDGSDLHALRPSTPNVNGSRGNSNFGGAYDSHPASGLPYGYVTDNGNSVWYPGNADAGMIARHAFYMDTRYDGTESGTTDLVVVNGNPANGGSAMGDKARLIEWHYAVPPVSFELRRNDIIHDNYQNNRNPFIDRPEFVWSVFVDQANDSRITINGAPTNANGGSTQTINLGRVFVGSSVPTVPQFTLNKSGTDGKYYEITKTGDATSTLLGRYNAFVTNATDSESITVGLTASATSSTGAKSGAVTVNNLDVTAGGCGGVGCGANDANDVFNLSLTVLDHAKPSFTNPATSTTITRNFGIRTTENAAASLDFDVFNLNTTAGFTANLDFDSVVAFAGDTSVLTTNADLFEGSLQLAGGTGHTFTATMDTGPVGSFDATYKLNFSDENVAGAQNFTLTLNLVGQVLLAGDFNRDNVVDTADWLVWSKSNGQSVAAYSFADGNGDMTVNDDDLDLWRRHFGEVAVGAGGSALGTGVPEPAGGAMLLMALAMTLGRRECHCWLVRGRPVSPMAKTQSECFSRACGGIT
jgi:endonuclease I